MIEKPIFVIQKHNARSLHYDFRLESNEVLISWAIPKGPSTNPAIKHLAIQTEDHSLEYATFEGIIPEGEYGAGAVLIWDRGPYKNLKNQPIETCLKDGIITVWLEGKKLKGGYALIKTDKRNWLFFKMKDQFANSDRDIVIDEPRSVISGKTIEEL